jgi:signal transduction histidine kinase
LAVQFESAGQPRRLEPEIELALYRIAQEALSNVVRHSGARDADVTLTFKPQTVTLAVRDDGRGFAVPESPAEMAPQGHYGLLGIHERAELIGSQLTIEAAPGRGTRLQVVVPA